MKIRNIKRYIEIRKGSWKCKFDGAEGIGRTSMLYHLENTHNMFLAKKCRKDGLGVKQ